MEVRLGPHKTSHRATRFNAAAFAAEGPVVTYSTSLTPRSTKKAALSLVTMTAALAQPALMAERTITLPKARSLAKLVANECLPRLIRSNRGSLVHRARMVS